MADNTQVTPGVGESIRSKDKGAAKTQVIAFDIGGGGVESLLDQRNSMPVMGSPGAPIRVGPPDYGIDSGNYFRTGQVVFSEPQDQSVLGAWNDGIGSASIDWKVPFNGQPGIKLDPQGQVASGTNPGTSPITTGVVWKRRFQFALAGIYSAECWIRWSSENNGTNTFSVLDHYNRDGTNAWLGRLWLDNTLNPLSLKIVDSTLSYIQIATCQIFPATHMYDLNGGRYDKGGQWSFARLIVDFAQRKYVGIQFNDVYYDLSAYSLVQLASTGAQAMHFGFSYAQKTSTRRYMHVCGLTGRRYA